MLGTKGVEKGGDRRVADVKGDNRGAGGVPLIIILFY